MFVVTHQQLCHVVIDFSVAHTIPTSSLILPFKSLNLPILVLSPLPMLFLTWLLIFHFSACILPSIPQAHGAHIWSGYWKYPSYDLISSMTLQSLIQLSGLPIGYEWKCWFFQDLYFYQTTSETTHLSWTVQQSCIPEGGCIVSSLFARITVLLPFLYLIWLLIFYFPVYRSVP